MTSVKGQEISNYLDLKDAFTNTNISKNTAKNQMTLIIEQLLITNLLLKLRIS